MKVTEKVWREIQTVMTWDQADAIRTGIMRDTPSLDVRVRSIYGAYVVEVSGPEKKS